MKRIRRSAACGTRGFWRRVSSNRIFTRLSEIIRRYLERRYPIQTMESTTTQVLDQLRKMALALDQQQLFRDFLPCCDLVKFAKYAPPAPEQERVTRLAFRILEVTRPADPDLPCCLGVHAGGR